MKILIEIACCDTNSGPGWAGIFLAEHTIIPPLVSERVFPGRSAGTEAFPS